MSRGVSARRRSFQRARSVVASVALTILALGCGGASDDAADAGSAADGEPAASVGALTDIDPCSLVTQEEAGTALGASPGAGERPKEANIPPRLATCRYVAPRGQGVAVMSVMVRQGESDSEARIGFDQAKAQFPGAETVPGLGENAFWFGNQLNVLQGRAYLNITGDFDLATARMLAETALQRL